MKVKHEYYSLSDEELVSLSHVGDTDADEVLYERYKNTVRIKARPYFLIGADHEDLLQEGMIGLYKAIRDYDPEYRTGFRSFAEMCIVRQIITAIKSATRRKHMPLNSFVSLYQNAYEEETERPMIDTISSSHIENPEEAFITKEALEDISIIIETQLSPLEKQVLSLRLDGRSYNEIAQTLDVGSKTVDNALQRVKRKLEKYYNK